MGGTWASYPVAYQEEFCRDLFYAANTFDDEAVRRGVLTEPQVARTVVERLPHGSALFLGNSMPIRDVDFYSGPFPSDGGGGGGGGGGGSPNALNGGTGLGASGSGGGAEETQVGDSTPEAQPLLTLPASSGRCTSAGLLG